MKWIDVHDCGSPSHSLFFLLFLFEHFWLERGQSGKRKLRDKFKKLQTYCLIFISFLDYGFHTIMSQQGWVEASFTALCHQLWRVLLITFYPWDKTSLQILERTYTFFSGVSVFQPVFAKIGSSRNELPDLSRERIISIYLWQTDSRCCLKCKLCC